MAPATSPQVPDVKGTLYLAVEEYAVASSILAELGFRTESCHPRQVGTSGLQEITRRIHHRQFAGVWTDLFQLISTQQSRSNPS